MVLDIVKWTVFGAVLLILLPYAALAASGIFVGLARQLPGGARRPSKRTLDGAPGSPSGEAGAAAGLVAAAPTQGAEAPRVSG